MEIWGGIECTINRVDDEYFDQVDYLGHFRRKDDLKHICDLGIKKMRYPVLWEKHQPDSVAEVNWGPVENNLNYLKQRNVEVIAGLVHHGSGPAYVDLTEDSFADGLEAYAEKVATKFPWINYYTPVNEPLTTARFTGLYGLWYPHHRDTSSFLKILINECRATIMAMEAIRKINPSAKLVFTEDLGSVHSCSELKYQADFENERRWLSIDLLCGRVTPVHPFWNYILDSGIMYEELEYFINHAMVPDVLGFNYYITSERYLDNDTNKYPVHTHGGNSKESYADIEAIRTDQADIDGPEKLLQTAWDRYQLPIAVTEVHLQCGREDQLRWLQFIWNAANKLKTKKVNVIAVTSWSLLGAYGWDKLLTAPKGNYEAGAFELRSGKLRPTALTKQIKALATGKHFSHPVLSVSGWWERESRFNYRKNPTVRESEKSNFIRPIIIFGATEEFAKKFTKIGEERDICCKAFTKDQLAVNEIHLLNQIIAEYNPWAVINATEIEYSAKSNLEDHFIGCTTAALNLSIICSSAGIKLLTFSSDMVINRNEGYDSLIDASEPQNIYWINKSKTDEQLMIFNPDALIIRPAQIFNDSGSRNPLPQLFSPFKSADIVNSCLDFLIDDENGIWYLGDNGIFNWQELIRKTIMNPN